MRNPKLESGDVATARLERPHSRAGIGERQVTSLRGGCKKSRSGRGINKQGRRRSMPPTTLPAPEIEIGSRLPVRWNMPRDFTDECELVHIWCEKLQAAAAEGQTLCPMPCSVPRAGTGSTARFAGLGGVRPGA